MILLYNMVIIIYQIMILIIYINDINTDFNFIFNEIPPIQFKDNFITSTSNLISFNAFIFLFIQLIIY